MGKAEVRDQLYEFLERGTEYAFEELKPVSVVAPDFLPGNGVVKLLLRPLIDDSVKEIEMGLKNELTLVMDYSEELARDENADAKKYRRKFLESDIFFRHYEGDRKDELQKVMIRHFEEMARDMVPLIRTDADGFWEGTREAYSKYETEEILRHHFSFVEKVVEEFGDGLEMRFSLGPFDIGYTREALRILPEVEERLRLELVDELDDVYGSGYDAVGSDKLTGKTSEEAEVREEETEEDVKVDAKAGAEADGELEKLRERVEELEEENEELREELKQEREKNEELNEKLEDKEDSYKAEDWLG